MLFISTVAFFCAYPAGDTASHFRGAVYVPTAFRLRNNVNLVVSGKVVEWKVATKPLEGES